MRAVFLPIVVALAVGAMPAQAVTFFSVGGISSGLAPFETLLVDFDSPLHAGIVETSHGTVGIFTTTSKTAAEPAGDTTAYMAIGTGGGVVFDLRAYFASQSRAIRSISVFIGSVDPWNRIQILDLNLNLIANIKGSDLPSDSGDQGADITNRRLYISFLESEHVGGIKFFSSGIAFEFDDIAASSAVYLNNSDKVPVILPPASNVPEPTTWASLVMGLALVGIAMRRRKSVLISAM